MNLSEGVVKNLVLNLENNVKKISDNSNKYSDNLAKFLNEIFIDVDYLTAVLNVEIPYLESIADKLLEKNLHLL